MTALLNAAQKIDPSWIDLIGPELQQPYMDHLSKFLETELKGGQSVYPPKDDIFRALQSPVKAIKVVILGQDPYHGPGQANGLAFSVHKGVKIPPSLRNIYKEVFSSVPADIPHHGDLTSWAKQGALLLNTTLTVREAAAASHQKQGWEEFTDAVIKAISRHGENIVFMLWGSHAQKKAVLIDHARHLILEAPHPSPLSAHRGFLGCAHFTKANIYLAEHGLSQIDWMDLS